MDNKRTLRLSMAQWAALPIQAFVNPRFRARFRRPWHHLTFDTPADCTLFLLRYSEYCRKTHPFEAYSLQDLQV